MRSTIQPRSSGLQRLGRRSTAGVVLLTLGLLSGCAHLPNHFREDGPSATATWDSPTVADLRARYQPAPLRERGWPATTVAAENGAVIHWPLYFEDPFEDKGHGRTDATHPHDVYRGGWEDYVALPYSFARFTANWLLLPVSAIVTPPWTLMESDGQLSRQILGYDHDAVPIVPWPGFGPSPRDVPASPEPKTPPPQIESTVAAR